MKGERMLRRFFERRIARKAKRNVARQLSVSYQQVHKMITNNGRMESSKISREEWMKRGMLIA
jgi:hypothetical protein